MPSEDAEDKTVVFRGVDELYNTFHGMFYTGEDYLIVNSRRSLASLLNLVSKCTCSPVDVSADAYNRIDEERGIRGRKVRFFFLADKRQLRVTVPSGRHESTHSNLFGALWGDMKATPSLPRWLSQAATAFPGPDGKSAKEADSAGRPGGNDTTGGELGWPSLVIECGGSQSMRSLHMAMRWWFWASDHHVTIVLVAKLHRSSHTMAIEKFAEELVDIARPGATTTRSSARFGPRRLQPVLQQTITIAPVAGSNPERYQVTRGALVLEFALMYRRPPGPSPGDRDIVVSESELKEVAGDVWALRL